MQQLINIDDYEERLTLGFTFNFNQLWLTRTRWKIQGRLPSRAYQILNDHLHSWINNPWNEMKGKIKGCLIFGVIFCAEGPNFHYWGWKSPKRRKPPLAHALVIFDAGPHFHFGIYQKYSSSPFPKTLPTVFSRPGSGLCVWNTKCYPAFTIRMESTEPSEIIWFDQSMTTWFASSVPLVNADGKD